MQVAADTSPRQVALLLGLPMAQIQVVMRNHKAIQMDDPLAEGDRLVFIPLIDGG